MTSRFVLPFADVGAGITPSSGAKLFFYETGTTTPKDTYSDSAGTIPNTNPVIANSLGVFPDIFITGAYKVVLKNSADVQSWSADPVDEYVTFTTGGYVTKTELAAAGGAGLVGYNQGGTGAVTRTVEEKLQDNESVVDRGGSGDGVTDDRQAIADMDTDGIVILTGYKDYFVNTNLTITNDIYFVGGARIKPAAGVTVTINGVIRCDGKRNPFTGLGLVNNNLVTVQVPADFATVQEAVNYFPKNLYQYCQVRLATGTYSENLLIEGFRCMSQEFAASEPGREGARLIVTGANGISQDASVKINSILVNGCIGGVGVVSISNLSVIDKDSVYQTNTSAIGCYNSDEVQITDVDFSQSVNTTGAAVLAYGGHVHCENLSFGTDKHDVLFKTKHNGRISDFGTNSGKAIDYVFDAGDGDIRTQAFNDCTFGIDSVANNRNPGGGRAGLVVDLESGHIYGATKLISQGLPITSISEQFAGGIDGYFQTVTGTGFLSMDKSTGIELQTGATSGSVAQISLTRSYWLSARSWGYRVFSAAVAFTLTGSNTAYIVTGSTASKYVGFKQTSAGVYGVTNDGVSESTLLIDATPIGTLQALEVRFYAGSRADFYQGGSYVGSITTNLPSGGGESTVFDAKNENTSAIGQEVVVCEWALTCS